MAAVAVILKVYFSLLFMNQRPIDMKLGRKHSGDCKSKLAKNRSY